MLPFRRPASLCRRIWTKHIRNDGACHDKPDAEGTDVESDSDVEKQFDESTGNLA